MKLDLTKLTAEINSKISIFEKRQNEFAEKDNFPFYMYFKGKIDGLEQLIDIIYQNEEYFTFTKDQKVKYYIEQYLKYLLKNIIDMDGPGKEVATEIYKDLSMLLITPNPEDIFPGLNK